MDLTLELGTEGYSPNLLRKIEYAGGNTSSFAEGSEALRHLAEFAISAKHVERLTERLGRERLATRERAVAAHKAGDLKPRYADPPAVVAIHVDAGNLQARAEDGGPGVREPHWRDHKVACLATYPDVSHETDPQPTPPSAFLDPPRVARLCAELARVRSGECTPPRQEASQSTMEPTEPSYERGPKPLVRTAVATLGDSDEFGWQVSAEAQSRGFYAAQRGAVVGDGGNWIGPLAQFHFPGWTQVLDFLHLLANLYSAACCVWPKVGTRRWALYSELLLASWAGEVEKVLCLLRRQQRRVGLPSDKAPDDDLRSRLARVIAYVEDNRHRMNYPRYRREGLPISSALVESLIKQFNKRVKGTEKFWNEDGAESVLQVRAAYLSEDDRAVAHYTQRPLPRAARRGGFGAAA